MDTLENITPRPDDYVDPRLSGSKKKKGGSIQANLF